MKGIRVTALIVVLASSLVACGGSDDETSAASTEPTDAATTEPTDVGGQDDPGAFGSAECTEALTAWSAASSAAAQAISASASDLDASLAELEAFAAAAPEEIRDDLTLIYETYGEFLQALEDSGYDPASGEVPSAETLAAITAASERLSETEVTEASDRVNAWFESNCGA